MEAPDVEKAVHEEVGKLDVARRRFSSGRKRIEELQVWHSRPRHSTCSTPWSSSGLHEMEIFLAHREA